MRQVLTWRFLAAIAALGLLAIGVDTVFADGPAGSVAGADLADVGDDGTVVTRRIDLISATQRIDASEDFSVGPDGLTTGFLDAVLDQNRVVRVAPGTPGVVDCESFTVEDRCAVFADLLGEAVVWFAVLSSPDGETVELPPIVDLQDGYAQFENGWEILYPPVIERDEESCAGTDIPSFSDFLRRFGPNSTSVVDLSAQQVVEVRCGEEFVEPEPAEPYEGDIDGSFVYDPATVGTTIAPLIDPDVAAPEN